MTDLRALAEAAKAATSDNWFRAEAVEAALSAERAEVERLRAELARVKPDHRAMAQAVAEAGNVEMLPVVRIERHELPDLTKETPHAE